MAKIMIADDNVSVLYLLREIITKAGHEIIASTNNGEDALRYYFDHAPDVTILDNQMPQMNGIDVAQYILAIEAKAKIILCTGDYEEIGHVVSDLGLTLIPKPFKPDAVLQAIDHLLERQ